MKPLILSCLFLIALPAIAPAQDWALDGYDPVSYFAGDALPGRSDVATMWKGRLWHFASEDNRAAFEADPHSFLPGFGGLCPLALSRGKKIPGDPRYFAVIDSHLYFLRSVSARREFMRDPQPVLEMAGRTWALMR